MKKKFNKDEYLYKIMSAYLYNSLDSWQIKEITEICYKFYKKGKENL